MTKAAIIATIVVMVVTAVAGYRAGAAQCEAHHQAQRADLEAQHRAALERAIGEAEARQLADAELLFAAAERAQQRDTATREIVRTITRVIHQEPDYSRCRLDDCGLCLARAAATDSPAEGCPCGADGPLPGAAGAGGNNGGSAGGLHRDSEPLPRLPGPAADTGGVGQ